MIHKSIILSAIVFLLMSCNESKCSHNHDDTKKKNEVLILGTIHGQHRTDSIFNLAYLDKLVREINPDYILAEIPPNRFQEAIDGFNRDDTISEPRVMRFPEYVDVIFPLAKEMGFDIIPTAGWTKIMANERSKKLTAISKDPARADDWDTYIKANNKSDSIYEATGKINDPYFIHTDEYDRIQEISLQTYNRLFNEELALGGWENINIAHYWNIDKALEKHRYEGKRFLIVYGAGHKSWFIRELRKRDDIEILEMKPFLDSIN